LERALLLLFFAASVLAAPRVNYEVTGVVAVAAALLALYALKRSD